MAPVATRLSDVITKTEHDVVYDDAAIGGGQQGIVYPIHTIDGIPQSDFLLKFYRPVGAARAVQLERNLSELLLHLEANQATAGIWIKGLEALPRRVVHESAGDQRIGILVRRVNGPFLDQSDGRQFVGEGKLSLRLEIARQIADCAARLHAIGVVPADITSPNIIIDVVAQPARVYLIDIDGGGVLDPAGGYRTHPLVLGQSFAPWPPPEVHVGEKRECDEVSDRWTVAVAIHCCLFPYRQADGTWKYTQPFWWERSYLRCCGPDINWPPDSSIEASRPKAFAAYHRALEGLGPEIKSRFTKAFDRESRVAQPHRRPKAEDWENVLMRAKRWLYGCDCGSEFVALDRAHCPYCSLPIRHVTIRYGRGPLLTVRHDWMINGRAVGFPQSVGECAVLERHGRHVELQSRQPLLIDGQELTVGGRYVLEAGREYEVEIRPSGLRARGNRVAVSVPS